MDPLVVFDAEWMLVGRQAGSWKWEWSLSYPFRWLWCLVAYFLSCSSAAGSWIRLEDKKVMSAEGCKLRSKGHRCEGAVTKSASDAVLFWAFSRLMRFPHSGRGTKNSTACGLDLLICNCIIAVQSIISKTCLEYTVWCHIWPILPVPLSLTLRFASAQASLCSAKVADPQSGQLNSGRRAEGHCTKHLLLLLSLVW